MKTNFLVASPNDLRHGPIMRGIVGFLVSISLGLFLVSQIMQTGVAPSNDVIKNGNVPKPLVFLWGIDWLSSILPIIVLCSVLVAYIYYQVDRRILFAKAKSVGDPAGLAIMPILPAKDKHQISLQLAYNGMPLGKIILPAYMTWAEFVSVLHHSELLVDDNPYVTRVLQAYEDYQDTENSFGYDPTSSTGEKAATALTVLKDASNELIAQLYSELKKNIQADKVEPEQEIRKFGVGKESFTTMKSYKWLALPLGAWLGLALYKATSPNDSVYDYAGLAKNTEVASSPIIFYVFLPSIVVLIATLVGLFGYIVSALRESKTARKGLNKHVLYESPVTDDKRVVTISSKSGEGGLYELVVTDDKKVVTTDIADLSSSVISRISSQGFADTLKVSAGWYGAQVKDYAESPNADTLIALTDRLGSMTVRS